MNMNKELSPEPTPDRSVETVEQKKERLMPLLRGSLEVWNDSARELHEGSLTLV